MRLNFAIALMESLCGAEDFYLANPTYGASKQHRAERTNLGAMSRLTKTRFVTNSKTRSSSLSFLHRCIQGWHCQVNGDISFR
jgi:hypothetical protein